MDELQIAQEIRAAIKHGDTNRVTVLVGNNGALLNMMTPFGTWLHVAATFGRLEIVQHLISLGADIETRGGTFDGSALNLAASNGHIDIVRCLLSHGANVDTGAPERNPLFGAILDGHLDIVRLLIDVGVDTHVKYTGETMKNMDAVAFAREQGQTEIAELLSVVP